jgi:hypothetical protein
MYEYLYEYPGMWNIMKYYFYRAAKKYGKRYHQIEYMRLQHKAFDVDVSFSRQMRRKLSHRQNAEQGKCFRSGSGRDRYHQYHSARMHQGVRNRSTYSYRLSWQKVIKIFDLHY